MAQVPQNPLDDSSTDGKQDLQGYQDDFDTSQRDQFANDAGSDPTQETPATRAEWKEGMRDTAGTDEEGGTHKPSDDSDRLDDFREEVEGRDANDGARGPL